jgi:type VI secretion system protein ImpH
MASADRSASALVALQQALQETPHQWGFYAAVRRLECAHRDKPRFGQSRRAADDPLRFAQDPSLSFAPATLASFTPQGERPPRMAVNFLGLFGPNGPLPLHLTEYARDRLRNADDPTFVAFADVFHHRMLALFYRAWANAQPALHFDRPESDRFAVYVGALFGLGMPALRNRDALPDLAKLYYAGRLVSHTRPAEGLAAMLSDFLRLPVRIEQFVGQWLDIPATSRLRLGGTASGMTLVRNATLGARVWSRQHKFRVVVGPMPFADCEKLLPGGHSLVRLTALLRNYVGDQYSWDLQLLPKKESVPPLRLGQSGELGWTTWLMTQPLQRDPEGLLLNPQALEAA